MADEMDQQERQALYFKPAEEYPEKTTDLPKVTDNFIT
jgi:hypothetical protein